jgi:hypothetical protein
MAENLTAICEPTKNGGSTNVSQRYGPPRPPQGQLYHTCGEPNGIRKMSTQSSSQRHDDIETRRHTSRLGVPHLVALGDMKSRTCSCSVTREAIPLYTAQIAMAKIKGSETDKMEIRQDVTGE